MTYNLRIFMLWEYTRFDEIDNYHSTEDYFEDLVDNHINEEIMAKEDLKEKVETHTIEEYSKLRQIGLPKEISKRIVGLVII